jgi:hypothetical protein
MGGERGCVGGVPHLRAKGEGRSSNVAEAITTNDATVLRISRLGASTCAPGNADSWGALWGSRREKSTFQRVVHLRRKKCLRAPGTMFPM